MKYTVSRQRAYWVQETQVIEAATEEEAEDRFLDEFHPTLEIQGVCRFGTGEFSTPILVEEEGVSDDIQRDAHRTGRSGHSRCTVNGGERMTPRLNEKYVRHLQQCEIGSEEFIEVMETAWWALTHAMEAVGTHLDLTDEYLLTLREKVHKYMNDEIEEVNA